MVVGENVKSGGKGGGAKKTLVDVVALSILALATTNAFALTYTIDETNSPSASFYLPYTDLTGTYDSLSITGLGGINAPRPSTAALVIRSGVTAGSIVNSGSINGSSAGIKFSHATITGGIINNGTIFGGNYGIVSADATLSGGITNNAGSTINGGAVAGIFLNNSSLSGGIANNLGAQIIGGNFGISVTQSTVAGGIVNSGSISGGVGGIAINYSSLSGGITNRASASINGTGSGIELFNSSITGGIVNSGSITGYHNNAISIAGGSMVDYIANTGSINTPGWTGIALSRSTITGGLTNSGSISGNVNGINITFSSLAGGITNSIGGTISAPMLSAGKGINIVGNSDGGSTVDFIANLGGAINGGSTGIRLYFATMTGGITNSGSIGGGWGNGGIAIVSSTLVGGLTNTVGGTISGDDNHGVHIVKSLVDSIANIGGLITAGATGIYVIQQASITGGITNSGSIGGGAIGIFISDSTIAGGIKNTVGGTITGSYNAGIQIKAGSLVDYLANSGGYIGGVTAGIALQRSTITGGLSNGGSIVGSVYGVLISRSSIAGGIANSGSIISDTQASIALQNSNITDGFANAGTISGANNGIYISNSSLSGGIANTGSIFGANNGIYISNSSLSGGITNFGSITGVGGIPDAYGIQISNSSLSGGITNNNSIFGDAIAIAVSNTSLTGGIVNATGARITSGGNGIGLFNSTLSGGIVNIGSVGGGFVGISVSNSSLSGGIANAAGGQITGGLYGVGLLNSSLTGGIVNSGSISNVFTGSIGGAAIYISGNSTVDYVLNSGGTIAGNYGVVLEQSTVTSGIANNGSIGGSQTGIQIGHSTVYGGILNTGTIRGGVYSAIYVKSSNVQGGIINSGRLSGATNVNVCPGLSTCFAGLNLSHSSLSGGVLNSGSISGASYGVYVGSSNLAGGITNSVGGTIMGAPGQGIVITANSTIDYVSNKGGYINGILNAGTISSTRTGIAVVSYGTVGGGIVNSGSISGGQYSAIFIQSSKIEGGIKNTGILSGATIAGAWHGASYYAGLTLSHSSLSGGITNSGLITGGGYGIAVSNSSLITGGIANTFGGLIAGASYSGVYVGGNSTVDFITNNGGTISGGSGGGLNVGGIGLSYASIANGITNSGSIGGQSYGIGLIYSSLSGGIANSGSINGGVAGIGLASSTLTGGIINGIGAMVSGGMYGAGIAYSSAVDFLSNNGGTFSGGSAGIKLLSATITAGITNSGSIVGSGMYGFGVSLTQSSLAGGLNNINGGVIAGPFIGINVANSTVSDGITNSGSISGGIHGIVFGRSNLNGGIDNADGAVIYSSNSGNAIRIASGSTITGGITNSGSIGGGYTGIVISQSSLSGGIANTGTITGAVGIAINQGATIDSISNAGGYISSITNAGLISNIGGVAISVNNGGTIAGGIFNYGRLLGNTAIQVSGNSSGIVGGIANTGLIGGAGGVAIAVDLVSNLLLVTNTISGGQIGTIVGAVNGNASVNNSGVWALQSFTGNLTTGSPVQASISGNYSQAASGTLQFAVGGTSSGSYSTLNVGGSALFESGTNLDVVLNTLSGVTTISTLSGVVMSGALTAIPANFNVSDNSVLYNFNAVIDPTNSNWLDLVVTNSGACFGTVSYSTTGPCLVGLDSPSILVNPGVTIAGGSTGIQVLPGLSDGAAVNGYGINNQGVVSGATYGIQFLPYATLTGGITNGGTISGGVFGVQIANSSVSEGIVNSGLIVGVYQNSVGGGLLGNGVLVSGASLSGGILNTGSIRGGNTGINLINSQVSGGVFNSGVIQGGDITSYLSRGINLEFHTNLTGDIVNDSTGTISAGTAGINLVTSTLSGSILNYGLIQGTTSLRHDGTGIWLGGPYDGSGIGSQITGSIVNQGSIIGSVWGIGLLSNSVISGGIQNSGLISGSVAGLALVNGASINGGIVNTGILQGVGIAVAGDGSIAGNASGIYIAGSVSSAYLGSIVNHNMMQGLGGDASGNNALAGLGYGVAVNGITAYNMNIFGAAIQNSALGTIQGIGGNAYGSSAAGGGGYGIALLNGASYSNWYIPGSLIVNNGLIQGVGGAATGSGVISGSGVGIQIDSTSHAIAFGNVPGVIQNNGRVVGVGGNAQGLDVQAASGIGIEVLGSISGPTNNSGIYNTGTIQGIGGSLSLGSTGTAGAGGAIVIIGGHSLDITNSGLLSGIGGSAIGNGAIANGGFGIYLNSGAVVSGLINNTGTIQGSLGSASAGATTSFGGYGIYVGNFGLTYNSSITGGISNSGLIKGSTLAIYIDPTAAVSRIAIGGNNSASFSGDIYAPNTPVTVAGGAAYTINNAFTVSGFSNEGTLILNPGNTATIAGSSGAGSANFSQTNSGVLQVGVNAVSSGSYGQLYVDGNSSIGGAVNVSVAGLASGLTVGSTIVGVVMDSGSITTLSGFNVSSNTAKLAFTGIIVGNELDLVVGTTSGGCYGTVSANTSGPCLVAFDSPSLKVNSGVTISSGSDGIRVLPGLSDGASTNGFGISNQGSVIAWKGINLQAGSTLTGGITNSGIVNGGSRGLIMQAASLSGGLSNSGMISGSQGLIIDHSTVSGAIVNSGSISGGNGALNIGASSVDGIFNSGTISASIANAFYVVASTVNGQIFNSGSISGPSSGVVIWGGSNVIGGIDNAGTINSAGVGVGIYQSYSGGSIYSSQVSGGFTNSGYIQGGWTGIGLQNSTLSGGFINTGTILGGTEGFSEVGGLLAGNFINTGLIRGGSASSGFNSYEGTYYSGYAGSGLYLAGNNSISSFMNSGSIQGIGADVQTSFSGSGALHYSYGGNARGARFENGNTNALIGNAGFIGAQGGLAANNGTISQFIGGSSVAGYLELDLYGGSANALNINSLSSVLNNSGSIIGQGGITAFSGSVSQAFDVSSSASGYFNLYSRGGQASGLSASIQQQSDIQNSGLIMGVGGDSTIAYLQMNIDSRSALNLYSEGGTGAGLSSYSYESSIVGSLINTGTIAGFGGASSIAGLLNQSTGSSSTAGPISIQSQGGVGVGLMTYNSSGINIQNSGMIEGIGGSSTISNFILNSNSGSSVNVNNAGGSGIGEFIYLWSHSNTSVVGGLLNTGTIVGYGGNAFVSIGGAYTGAQATISAGGGQGIGLNLVSYGTQGVWSGGIVNSGLIAGAGGSGVSLNSVATTTGGMGVGLKLSIAPYFSSSTMMMSGRNVIQGAVSNSGTIQGIGGFVSGGVLATGGTGFGMYLGDDRVNCNTHCGNATVTGALLNSGLIQGIGGNAIGTSVVGGNGYGVALLNGSLISGGISNTGVIKGVGGNAVGNGISGDGYGIYIDAMSSVAGGINNSGTIVGLAGSASGGAIAGNSYAIYAPFDGLASIGVSGVNARIIGDVYAPNATLTVQNGATFTNTNSFNLNSFNIENGSTFNFINSPIVSASVAGGITVQNAVVNSGNLNVGSSTPTITGNYVQSNAGTFSAAIASQTNYGKLNVTGAATLAGVAAITVLNPAAALASGSTLVGMISAGTLSGTFAQVTTSGTSLYTFTPVYVDNQFDLAVKSNAIFAQIVMANNNPAALGSATVLDGFISNPTANPNMAPVLDRLNSIYGTGNGAGVSNAISQTLPVIVGAGSLIASQTQQGLNQIMQGRQNQLRGLSSGEEYIGNRNAWMKGYGSWANQGNVNNVSGYKVNTGGLAVGADWELSPKANLGAVFAFGNSGVSSNNSAAASGMTVNSYQLGAYGDYAVQPDIQVNYQADIGLNNNKEYRNLSDFNGVQGVSSSSSGVNANGNYNSYVGHLGAGLRRFISLTEDTTFIPSVRADYTSVQSQGYTETGAGTLNLGANAQSYNTLLTSADLRVDHMLADKFKLSANVGAGYNALNNQVQMTTAFQGGGPAFTTNGLQISPWLYNAGLGLSGRVSRDVELNVRYDTQFSTSGYNNQMVSAKIKLFY